MVGVELPGVSQAFAKVSPTECSRRKFEGTLDIGLGPFEGANPESEPAM